MTSFDIHGKETAPEASRGALEKVEGAFGFIPNMIGVLSEAPVAVNAYVGLMFGLDRNGTLSAAERQFLMIAVSAYNGCEYCVPAHSTAAFKSGLDADKIAAAASGDATDDPRLEALRSFALVLLDKRGRASESDVLAFLGAGFTKAQILEVIVALAAKTISNYTNHIAEAPLDPQFQTQA